METEEGLKEMDWDPEDAQKVGTVKCFIEFKTVTNHDSINAQFSEPKMKKKKSSSAKVVDLKKNKDALF